MATVGEVQYCGRETRGQIVTLRYFNGRPVVSLGGGYNKIFVVEEKGAVSALHPLENELDAFGEEQELSIEKQSLENLGEIKMIRCGRGHTLYLTQDGFVFASGKGAFGVLGLGGALNSPTPVTLKTLSDKTVVMVACGSEHSLALTDLGDVYSWGRGFEGQLGISKVTTVSSTPKYLKALRGHPVAKVACGHSHSLVLTKAGELFTWGEGRCGQLGCGVQRACFIPQQVIFKNRQEQPITIVDMAGGSGHSGAVTASGDLYMWGLNNYGQLGVGDQEPRFYPTPVLQDVVGVYLHDIKQLACSDYSSFVIDNQGSLYSWGKGFIGHNNETLELLPRKVELNTEHRVFSQLYAAGTVFACFAPLHVYSISPFCGPVAGGSKLSLIGTAFAQSEELRVRFRYEGNVVERPCEFDQETNSLVCFTPSFQEEGEELTLPCASELEVTMDGEHYVPCDEKFLIYAKDLQPTSLNPKCAAVSGSTILQIDIDLEAFQQAWLWHLTVGFAVKPKAKVYASPTVKREQNRTPSHDESRMSQASGRGESTSGDVEWHLTAGKYEKGQVTCKVPTLDSYDENSMAYMVDIAPNGQQFTGKPLNFRYYDVTVTSVEPLSGSINAGTTIVIAGKGLYDSSAKKLHLKAGENGHREVVLEWDRKNKTYIGLVPPLSWLFKSTEPDIYALKQIAKEAVTMELTLNGMDFIPLPSFHYIDITLLRFSKAKLDPTLPADKAALVWQGEDPLPVAELPEVKQKREADEAIEMNVSVRPGHKVYIWVEDLVKTEGLTARFMVEGKTADVKAVYKNQQKAGVVVPDMGDSQTPVEVKVELSMNGQSFSECGKTLKYLGATAPEEGAKRKGK